ncbi:MAG TPA: hypothetical protein VFN10_04080 [Thermoanaerobaculia bacterium]|nr:hypothetical protein [Thermoanaerobaculia bacterium]
MKVLSAVLLLLCAPLFAIETKSIAVPFAAGAVPSLAADGQGGFVASYIDPAAKELKIARWQNGQWSQPSVVARGADLMINKFDFPVVAARGNELVASWITKKGHGSAVHVARSSDGGATWTTARTPHPDMASEFGFPAVAFANDGAAELIWLDGRGLEGGMEGHGEMQLHRAVLTRDGALANEETIDARVCDCCATALAMTASGPIAIYRDRSHEDVRDIAAVRRTAKGWTAAQKVASDGWSIKGCPVNGPQVDARGNEVVVAWFTAANAKPAVKVAFSHDGGATFDAPVVLDETKPVGRVDVAFAANGEALVSWVGESEAMVQRVSSRGASGAATRIGKANGFPRLAVSKENAAIIWSAADGVHFTQIR